MGLEDKLKIKNECKEKGCYRCHVKQCTYFTDKKYCTGFYWLITKEENVYKSTNN